MILKEMLSKNILNSSIIIVRFYINFYFRRIDILILNAGVFALPYTTTEDSIEATFQICHLSHFYLTISLEKLLTHNSRVVVVSSESHRFSNLPKDNLTEKHLSPSQSKYWNMMAYNNVKLCNVLFAKELARVSFFFDFI